MRKEKKELMKIRLKAAGEKIWQGTKGKLAALLTVCILAGGIAEYHFGGVYASETSVSGNEGSTVSGNEGGTVSGTEDSSADDSVEDLEQLAALLSLDAEPVALSEGSDVTCSDQVDIEISSFRFIAKDGRDITYTTGTDPSGNTLYNLADGSVSIYDLGKISFELSLDIAKDDDSRTLKAGNYVAVNIPEGFTAAGELDGKVISYSGVEIATCQVDTGNHVLKVIFTENVEWPDPGYLDISCGLNMEMSFDAESSHNRNVVLLAGSGTRKGITLQLPENPSTVSGITKSGSFDAGKGTVTWTIGIGTDAASKGVSLAGLVIKDVLSDAFGGTQNTYQIFTNNNRSIVNGLSWTLTDGSGTVLCDSNSSDGSSAIGLTVGDDSLSFTVSSSSTITAPVYLTIVTGVTEEALKAAQNQNGSVTVWNTASMEAGDDAGSLEIEGDASKSASVELDFNADCTKEGRAVDSNTIHWTVVVNGEAPYVNTYCGEVIDTLRAGFQYKEGSITYRASDGRSGTPIKISTALTDESGWTDTPQFYVEDCAGGQKLYFYLPQYSCARYDIEFDVETTDDFDENTAFSQDTGHEDEIANTVEVKAKMPYFTGVGPGYMDWDFGTPTGYSDFQVSMIKKEVSAADETTGRITWTVYPSTRESYTTAVITDTILSGTGGSDKQSYPSGSLASGTKLGDYKIEYQTQADAFLHSNGVTKTFCNVAELTVDNNAATAVESEPAKVSMTNSFASKSASVEYDAAGNPYFHYAITVNSEYMALNNVKITDNIADIRFFDSSDDSEITGISGLWQFDSAKYKLEVYDNHNALERSYDATNLPAGVGVIQFGGNSTGTADYNTVTAEFSAITNQKYVLHLYICLKDAAGNVLANEALRDKKIYAANSAKAVSDEVYDGTSGTPFIVTNSDKNALDNRSVVKSMSAANGATTTWQVVINRNGGTLEDAYVLDSINKNQKYDKAAIHLYEADFSNVDSITGNPKIGAEVTLKASKEAQAGDCYYEITVDENGRTLKVTLPDNSSKAYILQYDTMITNSSVKEIANSVCLNNDGTEYESGTASRRQTGGSWGTLRSIGDLKITALDASVAAALGMKGVKIAVYESEDCDAADMVDMGVTDGSGELTFYGLDVPIGSDSCTYYVKILSGPEGYELEDKVYPVSVPRNKTAELKIENERTAADAVVEIQKNFFYYSSSTNQPETVPDKQAEFQLICYPSMKVNDVDFTAVDLADLTREGEEKQVYFTGNAGSYTYCNDSSESGRTGSVKTDIDGKLALQGLPWGYYVLKETATADGFAVDGKEYCFAVKRIVTTGDGGGETVSFSVVYGWV